MVRLTDSALEQETAYRIGCCFEQSVGLGTSPLGATASPMIVMTLATNCLEPRREGTSVSRSLLIAVPLLPLSPK